MRLLNFSTADVSAAAESSRRNVNIVLVLDRSGSMGINGGTPCSTMKASAVQFVNRFTEKFDTLGLVTYSSSANHLPIDYPISDKFLSGTPSLPDVINKLDCTGATDMTDGLYYAYQAIKSKLLAGGLNVIVLFTDGQPNALTALNWPLRTATDNDVRYDPISPTQTITSAGSSYGPSTCTTSPAPIFTGVLTVLYPFIGATPHVQGWTGGLFDPDTQVALNDSAALLKPPGCYMTSNALNARADIAYIPWTDRWGNATTGYKAVDVFPSGPYKDFIRPDEQINGVIAAATNTADNLAAKIRMDPVFTTVIYTIGLGGAPDMPIDQVLMERLANDSRSASYNAAQPKGFFAYASEPGVLNEAFQQVASQILRLSQ